MSLFSSCKWKIVDFFSKRVNLGLSNVHNEEEKVMNKLLSLGVFIIGTMIFSESHAQWGHQWPSGRIPVRIVTVTGHASGGSSYGDRSAACNRAYDRAENEVAKQCSYHRGYLLNVVSMGCDCRGPSRDLVCRANARGECEVEIRGRR